MDVKGTSGKSPYEPVGPPILLLPCTMLAAAAGITLAYLNSSLWILVLAWFLSVVALGFAALYMMMDARRQSETFYYPATWAKVAYGIAVGLALIAVIYSAWQFALYIGRL